MERIERRGVAVAGGHLPVCDDSRLLVLLLSLPCSRSARWASRRRPCVRLGLPPAEVLDTTGLTQSTGLLSVAFLENQAPHGVNTHTPAAYKQITRGKK